MPTYMRKLSILLVFAFLSASGNAQQKSPKIKESWLNQPVPETDAKRQFANYDLSKLWTITDDQFVYGFIGDSYQRIRIKFTSVKKIEKFTYAVIGKTKVKDNICNFKGTFSISALGKLETTSYGVDDQYKKLGIKGQYHISGQYTLTEDSTQKNTGVFKGKFETSFYLDKNNKVHYDNIDLDADGFANNEFTGTWTQYTPQKTKVCNWGDYRIPNSGNLDIGAGEFSPNEKYIKNGWLDIRDQYQSTPSKKPVAKWWQ